MKNVDSLLAVLHSSSDDGIKIKALCEFYRTDANLSKVLISLNKGRYRRAVSNILLFLKKNEKGLLLICQPIKTNLKFAALVGDESLKSNFATIKTIGQLIDLYKTKPNVTISQLIRHYKRNKMPILCLNDAVDDQKKCRAIIHEIHAWLLGGCMKLAHIQGLFGEWRVHIPSTDLLKRMDRIIFDHEN